MNRREAIKTLVALPGLTLGPHWKAPTDQPKLTGETYLSIDLAQPRGSRSLGCLYQSDKSGTMVYLGEIDARGNVFTPPPTHNTTGKTLHNFAEIQRILNGGINPLLIPQSDHKPPR